MSKQVFISFAWKDHALVREAIEELRNRDMLGPGTVANAEDLFEKNATSYIRDQIKNRISNSNAVVVIWSKQAADSPWVQYELGMAQALNVPIVIALAESPAPQLPAGLKDIQVVRLNSSHPPLHLNKPAVKRTEHLEILRQGVAVWNDWRERNPYLRPDLCGADLQDIDTHGAYLAEADLRRVDLSGRDLSGAQLFDVDFTESKLNGSNLTKADLRRSHLFRADVIRANLEGAELQGTDLRQAYLMGANLKRIYMGGANFTAAALSQADFTGSTLNGTIFGENYLDDVIGLDSVIHNGPSVIDIETIYLSGGHVPEAFLRGCGVPEDFITYVRSLTTKAIDFYSCFISYSSKDQEFAERLHSDLRAKGVRVWFAPHDLSIGARIRPAIDESIRVHDKLLLVLSESSVSSQWVEQEVETALSKEREQDGRTVLFPIRIDDAVMESKAGWPALLRNTRNVGNFTRWKDHDSYSKALERLLRDLKAGA